MPSAKRKETLPLPPRPYVLSDTGRFDGNDGRWSTFFINIGDNGSGNGQTFRVLISTSSSATIVPGQTEWCDEDCAKKRGLELYNGQQPLGLQESAQWKVDNIYNVPIPDWWTDAYRIDGANISGVWGVDNIGLGTSSPDSLILEEQYVVKSLTKDFFMGSFGLAVGAVGPSSAAARPTFLENFYNASQIPSRSFGYTAGAAYRNNNNGIPGNLVLGGYDKARLRAAGTSISMPNKRNNTLAVGVQSILYSKNPDVETNTESLAGSGFSATIDSATPYLILPDGVCDEFVSKFGLQFDNSSQLFLVNSSSHKTNLYQNATVSFKIGAGPSDSSKFTSIVLPYEAFVQQASFPLAVPADNTQYFTIKRSENGIYVLGRTFLQEAYIIVDYERANFTVAPALFADPMPSPSIAPIYNESYAGLQPLPPNHDSKGGLPTGAIAGIVVGIVLAFALAGIGTFFWWRKHRNQKTKDTEAVKPSAIDTTEAGTEVKHRRVSELTGSDAPLSPKESAMGYYNPDNKSIPPISEMSPESTPAELYSPPPEGRDGTDYFAAGQMRRQGATRERGSSTVSTPIAELPGEGVMQGVSRTGSDASASAPKPPHSRSPSDSSLGTNIDTVLANDRANGLNGKRNLTTAKEDDEPAATSDEAAATHVGTVDEEHQPAGQSNAEQRPSHNRGLSDTTIHSESTAVSQPTAEELERWERAGDDVARPMSP